MALNPDLAEERLRPSFDVDAVSELLHGSAEDVQRWVELGELVASDPVFARVPFEDRLDRYQRALRRAQHMLDLSNDRGLGVEERKAVLELQDEFNPVALHWGMFVTSLFFQATDEQAMQWLPDAMQLRVIGTYAQTELGHGSNLSRLETTATFDRAAQEWDLHSPTLTSMKWWPGGLGQTANHVLLMANLIDGDGVNRGPHPFIVQIRAMDSHEPMPGVEVGSIGSKMGFECANNGFLRLSHVRVPRGQLLQKNATVDEQGRYERVAHAKSNFGTMLFVRASLVSGAGRSLGRAATIAARYSCVRRQFGSDGHKESKVLDYQTQQHKVLTQIATSVSLTLCGHQMRAMYDRQQDAAEGGDFSLLAETHATSSGLKALTTTLAAEGIEACRLACGGHGYSDASGLPQLYADVVAQRTYEGENTLMFLQTARYLMRQPAPPAAAAATPPVDNWRDPDALLRLFEARAAHLRRTTTSRGGGGGSEVDSVRMASAHCMAVVVRDAFAGARERRAPAAVQRLVLLFALTMLERELGEFFEAGLLSPAQAAAARATARELLAEVRPDAVPLTDAWRFTDHFLNSALGRYDGNVYEALYAYAKKDPMNVMGAERSRL